MQAKLSCTAIFPIFILTFMIQQEQPTLVCDLIDVVRSTMARALFLFLQSTVFPTPLNNGYHP